MITIAGTLVVSLLETGVIGASQGGQPGLLSSAVNVLGSLIIVLGILVVGLYWGKRFLKADQYGLKGKSVRVLGSTYLGMKKSISLVEIPGSILVLGLSNDNITLLSTIEDDDMEEVVKSHEHKEKDPVAPAWSNKLRVFSPSAERSSSKVTSPPVFSFVKGKILDFKKCQHLRLRSVRLHPVPVGKEDYE